MPVGAAINLGAKMVIKVVIGANYGDEGKGRVVNHLATSDSIVVRFNGGAQAGHTVVHDGIRHVFHSIGSGTLKGASTYWGPEFAADPISFFKEAEELYDKTGSMINVMAHPKCQIITPYDVWINQALENKRGNQRHGSCGMGFGESVRRNLGDYSLRISDTDVSEKLALIESEYFQSRIQELGLDVKVDPDIIKMYTDEFNSLQDHVDIIGFDGLEGDIIFEGAQGLCLDQNSVDFPNVTYSNTGLDNVLALLDPDVHDLVIHYITRTYLTRHGAGDLNNEYDLDIVDETNKPNPYQGDLRFAPLDIDRMTQEIESDLSKAKGFLHTSKLMITCCDQIEPCGDLTKINVDHHEACWGETAEFKELVHV